MRILLDVQAVEGHELTGFLTQSTDQTPLSSITLGPSFLPTTNAVSRSTPAASAGSIRIKGARKTWVGVQQGEAGEVWCWMEEERKDGSTEGEAAKVAYPVR